MPNQYREQRDATHAGLGGFEIQRLISFSVYLSPQTPLSLVSILYSINLLQVYLDGE